MSAPIHSAFSALGWGHAHTAFPDRLYTPQEPEAVLDPRLIAVSTPVARLLGVDPVSLDDEVLRDVVAGALIPPGAEPCALAYAGHQFGTYVAQLGDGRACLLGDVEAADGSRWDMQLKGSGPTPYSRGFDGRAVVRSTIREYLAGEAMAGLGVPTTRALAIVDSPLPVYREKLESAAVLLRVARTHIRFGTFQYLSQFRDRDALASFADLVIDSFMPGVEAGDYAGLLRFCCEETAYLLALWQAEGFAHGVMNTDNMSILGDTIDYGPFAFLDTFDPGFSPNTTDVGGRYAFGRQPAIALWNLERLADALSPILEPQSGRAALAGYAETFNRAFTERMSAKLGLEPADGDEDMHAADEELVTSLVAALAGARVDYTAFFRRLSLFEVVGRESVDRLCATAEIEHPIHDWLPRYIDRLDSRTDASRRARMQRTNPLFVLRNWIAEDIIERVKAGDYDAIDELGAVLADPYREHDGLERYSVLAEQPRTNLRLGCSS